MSSDRKLIVLEMSFMALLPLRGLRNSDDPNLKEEERGRNIKNLREFGSFREARLASGSCPMSTDPGGELPIREITR